MKRNSRRFAVEGVAGGNRTRRIVILARPPVDAFDVIGPAEVFGLANRLWPETKQPYRVELVSSGHNRLIESEIGIGLQSHATLAEEIRNAEPIDTLLVVSGLGNRNALQSKVTSWIRSQATTARRICSICVGAFTLAQSGVLDGKRATTHWAVAVELARLYPSIRVDPHPIWIQDGHVYTSAGISSGIDLCLALVAQDLGDDFAMSVAKTLVLFLRRPGGQAQFSTSMKSQAAGSKSLRRLQAWIVENIGQVLNLDVLAEQAATSRRTLIRLFKDELDITPAKYVESVRLEAAKRDIEMGNGSLHSIAARNGFHSMDVMRRTFTRNMGITPAQYEQRFKS